MGMADFAQLKEMFNQMNIKRAIIYDDKVKPISEQEQQQIIIDIFDGVQYNDYDIEEVVTTIGYDFLEMKEKIVDGDIPHNIIEKIRTDLPEVFNTGLMKFVDSNQNIFGTENVSLWDKSIDLDNLPDMHDAIVFLDYQLDGSSPHESEAFVKVLSKEKSSPPRCIVFISSKDAFTINGERCIMNDLRGKSKYFRSIRKNQEAQNYKNSLYEYIDKSRLIDEDNIFDELTRIHLSLLGGQKFYGLLGAIEKVLQESSKKVIGKFHLLNARSMKEILLEKVGAEGESESIFLMNWVARRISQTIIQNEDMLSAIHNTLEEIKNWQEPFEQLHEDEVIRDIYLEEMWDTGVNNRYMPIDFGDIFQIKYNGKERRAILLSQPCSLAVRSKGERSAKVAMLVLENPDMKKRKSAITITDWERNSLTFDFDETSSYPVELLDITTINKDGQAIIKFKKDSGVRPQILLPDAEVFNKCRKDLFKKHSVCFSQLITLSGNNLFQLNELYIPFSLSENENERIYTFSQIERLARLNQAKALDIFQQAQSFWGRIGLPVSINFMDDYIKHRWNLIINEGMEAKEVDLYIKTISNSINDIVVPLEDIKILLCQLYSESTEICDSICDTLDSNYAATYNYASGLRLVSLKKNMNCKKTIAKKGIYLDYSEKEKKVIVKVAKFSKCFLNEEDITEHVGDFAFDNDGELKFNINQSILKKFRCYEALIIEASSSTKEGIYKYLHRNRLITIGVKDINLHLKISDEEEEALLLTAAAKEVVISEDNFGTGLEHACQGDNNRNF